MNGLLRGLGPGPSVPLKSGPEQGYFPLELFPKLRT